MSPETEQPPRSQPSATSRLANARATQQRAADAAAAWPPTRTRAATPEEAEQRFWQRYGPEVLTVLLGPTEPPTTIDAWYALAKHVNALLDAPPLERSALLIERLARELRTSQASVTSNAEPSPEERASLWY